MEVLVILFAGHERAVVEVEAKRALILWAAVFVIGGTGAVVVGPPHYQVSGVWSGQLDYSGFTDPRHKRKRKYDDIRCDLEFHQRLE